MGSELPVAMKYLLSAKPFVMIVVSASLDRRVAVQVALLLNVAAAALKLEMLALFNVVLFVTVKLASWEFPVTFNVVESNEDAFKACTAVVPPDTVRPLVDVIEPEDTIEPERGIVMVPEKVALVPFKAPVRVPPESGKKAPSRNPLFTKVDAESAAVAEYVDVIFPDALIAAVVVVPFTAKLPVTDPLPIVAKPPTVKLANVPLELELIAPTEVRLFTCTGKLKEAALDVIVRSDVNVPPETLVK